MSDNKFILQLKGTQTPKSVVEIKNDKLVTPFTGVPHSTDVVGSIIDDKDSSVVVAKGAQNWKLDGSSLVVASSLSGDGADYTGEFNVSGNGLWINATYSLPATIFSAGTKWVLKLCGKNLLTTSGQTIGFTLIVKIGNTHITSKTFTVVEGANVFCRQLVIDFSESEQTIIKAQSGDSLTVQLLCSDANASATIYNGMTVFTALQRRVDGDVVVSDKKTFDELVEDVEDLEEYVDATFVKKAGDTMTGALNIADIASSNTPLLTLTHSSTATYKWNIAPRYNSTTLSIYPGSTETNGFRFATTGFVPASNNARYLGSASLKWKGVYTAMINNGGDLVVPAVSGTLATKADVDLAANSGRMITDKGVWYAKMDRNTVAPSAEDGTNYADFSQVDVKNNPVIVIYNRIGGEWVQDRTITPPAEYDGYVPITSKIWDIAEQAGQQGGRILWNHQSKEFTPYPQIISFEDIEITGSSTVIMPYNPSANQIVNKNYVDTLVSNSIGDATITLTQGGQTMGSFTTNQSGDATIALDGGSSYHPDLFDWKWADHQLNDVQWLRADTFSWQSGSVYQVAYKHLRNDMYNWYSWENNGTTIYTKKAYPEVGEKAYSDSALTTEVGEITDVTDTLDITVEKITVNGVVYDSVSGSNIAPTTETIAGVTVQYIPAEDGHKIVTDFHESEVADVYTATGVAWYYIIDYGFKRFKLPRTKFGVTGIRSGVGGLVEAGLPDIQGSMNAISDISNLGVNGAFSRTSAEVSGNGIDTTGGSTTWAYKFKASDSNSIYGNSNTVQPKATEMYLYFYVGNFTQTALENTAGLNAELFNDKADLNLANVLANIDFVVERQEPSAENNYTWYRKYRSGWVEQGGTLTYAGFVSNHTVNLPVEMADANYQTSVTLYGNTSGHDGSVNGTYFTAWSRTTTSFVTKLYNAQDIQQMWEVKGMSA